MRSLSPPTGDIMHPLWGGNGFCAVDEADPTGATLESCSCDDGFAPRDSLGNPSCVRPMALMYYYVIITAAAVVTLALLVWHLKQHRNLPRATRATRKAGIRLQFIVCASVLGICHAVLFSVAAAGKGTVPLTSSGVHQAFYTVCMPLGHLVAGTCVELWVECLPSRVLPAGSSAIRFKEFVGEHALFIKMNTVGCVFMALFGAMTFVFDPLAVAKLINLMFMFTGLWFVAVHLTLMINRGMAQQGQDLRLMYVKARRAVWAQTWALSGVGFVIISSFACLELTQVGLQTPIIPFSAVVFAQFSGSIMGVHFLAPTELRSTRSPNPTCSHLPRSDKKMNVMKTRSRATEIGSSTPTALDPKLRVNGSSQLAPAGSTIVPTDDGNGN
eukprot:jgi/Undpi1/6038/HiC_scaffold_2.g01312.m1